MKNTTIRDILTVVDLRNKYIDLKKNKRLQHKNKPH